ncbi:hypothetical protein VNO78_15092 [Psophocarpus tetragonolobus]|uniref:Pentatricopeptide repeat-containing protein n=1 Tax=Psophocarpus tetragonolobus TaxID=3891 RepID=A0AAN9SDZ9_PSOTE
MVEYAENLFDEMCGRGVQPSCLSYMVMVVGYCRMGNVLEADRWLSAMMERGFLVDNVTLPRLLWFCEIGLKLNLINFTCMIEGLCKRGSVKQAFEMLEEMVGKGWKPKVYTHTVLIDGLCQKGWAERAFRLFLKLVRTENFKQNVFTLRILP